MQCYLTQIIGTLELLHIRTAFQSVQPACEREPGPQQTVDIELLGGFASVCCSILPRLQWGVPRVPAWRELYKHCFLLRQKRRLLVFRGLKLEGHTEL